MKISVERVTKTGSCRLVGPKAKVSGPNRFLRALKARGLSGYTIEAYAFDIKAIYQWLQRKRKDFVAIKETNLVDFITHEKQRGIGPRTINRRLSTCRTLFKFLTGNVLSSQSGVNNPAPYYRGPGRERNLGLYSIRKPHRLAMRVKVPAKLVEPLTVEQVKLFLQSLRRYRDLAIVYSMLLCGLRSGEICAAKITDVSFEDNRWRIQGKGKKERALPMPNIVRDTIRRYLDLERPQPCHTDFLFVVLQGKRRGQGMNRDGLRRIFRTRRAKALLKDANAHRFRHTFGTDMARTGVRLPVLQKMLGHADSSTTLQYINLSMADIVEAYEKAVAEIQHRYGGGED